MTKEEFEKEFKVGDTVVLNPWNDEFEGEIKFYHALRDQILVETGDQAAIFHISHIVKKVEPVKKYWKTKFIQKWHTKPTEEVIIGFLNVKCDQKKLEELLGDKVTLIEEPEQIELKDI